MSIDVQPPNLSGRWYPSDRRELLAAVERHLGAERPLDPDLSAILVPHAAYQYSARAAGAAYARVVRGRWRRVLVLAPSHYHSFSGSAVFPGSGFATPLGVMRVDRDAVRALERTAFCRATAAPYEREHSLEIQLPFLQVVDPEIELVPVLVGTADDPDVLAALGEALGEIDDGETLFVVSSDFTHYGAAFDYLPFPATSAEVVSRELRRLDFGAIHSVERGDATGFQDYVAESGITVCGRGPIAAFLFMGRGRITGEVVDYYTSLDVTGDHEQSVSYAAIIFHPRVASS